MLPTDVPARPAMRLLIAALLFGTTLAPCKGWAAPATARGPGDAAFDRLVDDYYDGLLAFEPCFATELGLHAHDGELPDPSEAGRARASAYLRRSRDRFTAVDATRLSPPRAADLALLRTRLDARLVELEEVRGWQRYPDVYSSGANACVYSLVRRDFAPLADRTRSVVARLEKMPALLELGRRNLTAAARVPTEAALADLPGVIGFFRDDLPRAVAAVRDPPLRQRFDRANAGAIAALERYRAFLERDLLPRARPSSALGEELFAKKLRTEEMVTTSVGELLARGEAELRRLQAAYDAEQPAVDRLPPLPARPTPPTNAEILADIRARLVVLRRFLVEHDLVGLPGGDALPVVQETPPFLRAMTGASLMPPGPFEKGAAAFYSFTLPDETLPVEKRRARLDGYRPDGFDFTSIHEALPGHFVQLQWLVDVHSKVRQIDGQNLNTNVEGWAHYCEQMMLDAGYGDGDLRLRRAQRVGALLRAARLVVAIRLHTRGMSHADAVAFFQREAHLDADRALMEARRGAEDAMYLVYLVGKLGLLELRDDYRRQLGKAFTLRRFHDAVLAEGPLPLPLLRRALLGDAALADARFDELVDSWYAGYGARRPVDATDLGLHEHDGDLDDLSATGVAREVAELRDFAGRFARLAASDGRRLTARRRDDLAVVRGAIEARLLQLERVRDWRRYPSRYSRLASESVYVLVKRDFAPAAERLRSVVAREEKIPALLAAGRANLTEAARVSCAIAVEELPAITSFFERDVPQAFAGVSDAALVDRFRRANAAVMRALGEYRGFVEKELLPRAGASFALGEELLRARLRAEEHIETPTDELLREGEAELARLGAELRRTAARIDPKRSPAEVQASVGADHPAPATTIAETAARLAGLRRFLVDKELVTLPSEVMPRVQETPPFLRATTFASMDTPGPFETRATTAYYNETLPEPGWPAARVEDFMRGYARPLIDVVSIHEAFPGHYVQFLWMPLERSTVRRFEHPHSNVEGWAHYCEQMMVDEGWGGGDPRVRLMQLQDALLRAARFVACLRMHTRGMSFADAVALFERDGMQTKSVAEMEVKRGTEDATYLYYTWGKLAILRLRDEVRRREGARFRLGRFHDAVLAEGPLPLPLLRHALLAD